jgi:hypothetical protein
MEVTVTITGADKAARRIAELSPRVNMRLKEAIRDSAGDMERSAKQYAPVDMGLLRASIRSEIDPDGLGATIGPRDTIVARVMEYGRRPGARMPPVSALIPWVRRHGWVRRSRSKATYNGVSIAQASYDSGVRQAAFLLARSIARKGIRPRRYMQTAFNANYGSLIRRIRRAFE